MSVWTPADHGWFWAHSTPELRERAVDRQRAGDVAKPNDMRNVAELEERARGFVAEWLFADWLNEMGVPFTAHGGTDSLPDIEIGGRRIGVRCCATKLTWRPHFRVYVFTRHLRARSERFFLGYEQRVGLPGPGRYLLLGGLDYDTYVQGARFLAGGKQLVPGFKAEEDLMWRQAHELVGPLEWLGSYQGILV